MNVVSFFAGCGGLDLGFEQAGFNVVWANENDRTISSTYKLNHPSTILNTSDVRKISAEDIPDCDGFIGGPPCQSWSFGGKMRGLDDERGKLFLDYIRLIKGKKPKFFLIENVSGIISDKHFNTFRGLLSLLCDAGYNVQYSQLNTADYGVPQDRFRVFIVGFRRDLNIEFKFPEPTTPNEQHITLRRAIGDIREQPKMYNHENVYQDFVGIQNHDCYNGPYDKKFMARNRVRSWDDVSFTIQAQAKNCPLHPQAPPMLFVSSEQRIFVPECINLYRRLSVRECARIQTFPDSFHFIYDNILNGYKMVGNAVPPRMAKILATSIKEQFKLKDSNESQNDKERILIGYCRTDAQFELSKVNKLYYVRTGFRPGAFQWSPGKCSPGYLLLHRKQKIEIFRLDTNEPLIKEVCELRQLGFEPKGDVYLCFIIKENLDISNVSINNSFRKKLLHSTAPFITSLNSLTN